MILCPRKKYRLIFLGIGLLFISVHASARLEDGTLGILKLPNEGCPVMVAPGQTFKVTAEKKGEIFLITGDNRIIPLTARWNEENPKRYVAQITLPEKGIEEGMYAIQILSETNEKDMNIRSVFVRNEFTEYYSFAHISDIHIRNGDMHDPNAVMFQKVIEKLNQTDAHFILITGDLTHTTTPEQWQVFLTILNQSTKPTFVCAGNHESRERGEPYYDSLFYASFYAFRYGKDGFIVFDTREYRTADSWDEQDTFLYRYRRELKPCRWVFGVTHRYELTMGIRAQFILFVDDPIDFLLYGHLHRENTKEESVIPWGKTRVFVVPAEFQGYYRIFDVGEGGVFPRPIQKIVEDK